MKPTSFRMISCLDIICQKQETQSLAFFALVIRSIYQLMRRFRTNSYSLKIVTGRYVSVPRENRKCACGAVIQTILHCFTPCALP